MITTNGTFTWNPIEIVEAESTEEVFVVTVRDIVDAIEKNGLQQVTGEYVLFNADGKPAGVCALGQASVNLSIDYNSLFAAMEGIRSPKREMNLSDYIIYLNDNRKDSFAEIARKVRTYFYSALDYTLSFDSSDRRQYFS
jgi:hypothetical protein